MRDKLKSQLNHRSIRHFKDQAVPTEIMDLIFEVTQHTASSLFLQQCSVLHITDEKKRSQIREICGQDYIGRNGELVIFVADLYRNTTLRRQQGKNDGLAHSTSMFLGAVQDTLLAAQNTMNAIEALDLGGVFLGSIMIEPRKLIKVLDLPELTFPIVGMQFGYPDQMPGMKPRLPKAEVVFENGYPTNFNQANFDAYDKALTTYYQDRPSPYALPSFSQQVGSARLENDYIQDPLKEVLHEQGLCLD